MRGVRLKSLRTWPASGADAGSRSRIVKPPWIYAHVLKDLADIDFPRAWTIVLVQDNLNVHSKGSLYAAFPSAEARRLIERFEWHYTPEHGSCLDLAESEPGVL